MAVAADDWARVMSEAEQIVGFGVWEWDIASGVVQWSDALHRIYGLEPGEFAGTVDGFVAHLHPDDRERVWAQHLAGGRARVESFAFEERIVRADGEERVLLSQGHVIADAARLRRDADRRLPRRHRARRGGARARPQRAAHARDHRQHAVDRRRQGPRRPLPDGQRASPAASWACTPTSSSGSKCVDLFPAELAEQLLAADRRAAAEGAAGLRRGGPAPRRRAAHLRHRDLPAARQQTAVRSRRARSAPTSPSAASARASAASASSGRAPDQLGAQRAPACSPSPSRSSISPPARSSRTELLVRMRADDGTASCSPRRSCPPPSASG